MSEQKEARVKIIGTCEEAAAEKRKFSLDRLSAANSSWLFLLWGGAYMYLTMVLLSRNMAQDRAHFFVEASLCNRYCSPLEKQRADCRQTVWISPSWHLLITVSYRINKIPNILRPGNIDIQIREFNFDLNRSLRRLHVVWFWIFEFLYTLIIRPNVNNPEKR